MKQESKTARILIDRINGIDIYAVKDESGKELVPIRPICQAIGVSYSSQVQKVQSHPIYSSTVLLSNTVGADGKDREMLCIDAEFVYGWLLGIHPDNVSDQARPKLIEYQIECHHALYKHFHGRAKRLQEITEEEREAMKEKAEADEMAKEARARQKAADEKLRKIRDARLGTES